MVVDVLRGVFDGIRRQLARWARAGPCPGRGDVLAGQPVHGPSVMLPLPAMVVGSGKADLVQGPGGER